MKQFFSFITCNARYLSTRFTDLNDVSVVLSKAIKARRGDGREALER